MDAGSTRKARSFQNEDPRSDCSPNFSRLLCISLPLLSSKSFICLLPMIGSFFLDGGSSSLSSLSSFWSSSFGVLEFEPEIVSDADLPDLPGLPVLCLDLYLSNRKNQYRVAASLSLTYQVIGLSTNHCNNNNPSSHYHRCTYCWLSRCCCFHGSRSCCVRSQLQRLRCYYLRRLWCHCSYLYYCRFSCLRCCCDCCCCFCCYRCRRRFPSPYHSPCHRHYHCHFSHC